MYYRPSRHCYPYGGYPYGYGYPYGGYPYGGYPYGGYPYYSPLTPIYDSSIYGNPYLTSRAPPTPLQVAYAMNYGA